MTHVSNTPLSSPVSGNAGENVVHLVVGGRTPSATARVHAAALGAMPVRAMQSVSEESLRSELRALLERSAAVVLHAHSDTAAIAIAALDHADLSHSRERLAVYSYGGSVWVPAAMAARVANVVNLQDPTAMKALRQAPQGERETALFQDWALDFLNENLYAGHLHSPTTADRAVQLNPPSDVQ